MHNPSLVVAMEQDSLRHTCQVMVRGPAAHSAHRPTYLPIATASYLPAVSSAYVQAWRPFTSQRSRSMPCRTTTLHTCKYNLSQLQPGRCSNLLTRMPTSHQPAQMLCAGQRTQRRQATRALALHAGPLRSGQAVLCSDGCGRRCGASAAP